MPLSLLYKGQVTDGSDSKILGWTALVIEEFFQLTICKSLTDVF
jgi:hypothetical protein